MVGGSEGRCEHRSEVFVKIQKTKKLGGGGFGRGGVWSGRGGGFGLGFGGQGGCERRIEVFVQIQKKM